MEPSTKPGKRGPKLKGDRIRTSAALPAEAVRRVLAIAERDGQTFTDVLGRLLCEALDLPVPSYCLPKKTRESDPQQELPLDKAS